MGSSVHFGYRNLGEVVQFNELAAIYESIVKHMPQRRLPNGDFYITKKFKGGTLYAVDYKGIRYVEQNQNTPSAYAERARQGAKIVWVIRKADNEYLGYIEDGVVWMK